MSDRIDHVAEALEFQDVSQLVAHDSMEAATFAVRHAHVHATLALVEQTRIANLIALASLDPGDELEYLLRDEAKHRLAGWVFDPPADEHPEIRLDIAEALGIKTGDNDE